MGKKSCNHSELKNKGKRLADLRESIIDLNHKRMNSGLTESEQDRMERFTHQHDQLQKEIGDCGENPDLYEEMGMKEIENEDENEDDDEENADSDEKEYYED